MAASDLNKYLDLILQKKKKILEVYDFTKVNELSGDVEEAEDYALFIEDRERLFDDMRQIDELLLEFQNIQLNDEIKKEMNEIKKIAKYIMEIDSKNFENAKTIKSMIEDNISQIAQNKQIKNYAGYSGFPQGRSFDSKN